MASSGEAVICFIAILLNLVNYTSTQRIGSEPYTNNSICPSMHLRTNPLSLRKLKDCVTILGNLKVVLFENSSPKDFRTSYPKLREVTGYIIIYRIRGLHSLEQLFPNLIRIRGTEVFDSFSLIIHDVQDLKLIGLNNLLKIDRGGVAVWGGVQTCYVDTIDWDAIAPNSRHVLTPADKLALCNPICSCDNNARTNHCWSNMVCQRYITGPAAEECHEQCLGCRKTNRTYCSLCRFYTYRLDCVPNCPPGTLILPENKYCLTDSECKSLDRWPWNGTCISECPTGYIFKRNDNNYFCDSCPECGQNCTLPAIQALNSIQGAKGCINIHGPLIIHVRAVPEANEELKTYLSKIQVVTDYVVIYGSQIISSLDFLPSLREIQGKKLLDNKYSLVVHNMVTLQSLFTPNVTQHLKVGNGSMKFYGNPLLCMSHIRKLQSVFPIQPNSDDIPIGMNGYSAGCEEVSLGFGVKLISETSATVTFTPTADINVHYTILYVRLPIHSHADIAPESCADPKWNVINVGQRLTSFGSVTLYKLRPASTYAICVETYDPVRNHLARTSIINITTPVGKPEPPFIIELVAKASDLVVVRWVDHEDYRPHITHYELDVALVEIESKDVRVRDHCKYNNEMFEIDYTRHAVVMRAPPEYVKGCESMCGILSRATPGALVEEYFDVCSSVDCGCNDDKRVPFENSTRDGFVRTLSLNISGSKTEFQVGGLAPFRDYRFSLRACVNNNCSRSFRSSVRTYRSETADIPVITKLETDSLGNISVNWSPPKLTNGPVLAYSVQVLPKIKLSESGQLLPQVQCVLSNKSSLVLRSHIASKYFVRVCGMTLASSSACCDWKKIKADIKDTNEMYQTWWWSGVFCGVILYVTSILATFVRHRKVQEYNDETPLVDLTSVYRNESEPPAVMSSDFVLFYSLTDAQFD